jgi:ureidoacrylate peracid hydrolase
MNKILKTEKTLGFLFVSLLLSCLNVDRLLKKPPTADLINMHGPVFIKAFIETGNVKSFSEERARIASHRWKIAIDGARNAGRPIPILATIDGKRTALLVVDMQRGFLDVGASIEVPDGRAIVPNINKIAAALRQKGGRVIFFQVRVSEQDGLLKYFEGKSYLGGNRESPMKAFQPGNPQFELYPELDAQKSDTIMQKTRYSAVLGSDIVEVLQKMGIENVIVTGVTTDVCAGNTAEGLMQKDFHVVMVWDGCAALDRLEHELYLARIFGLYGDVMPTEEVIARLK